MTASTEPYLPPIGHIRINIQRSEYHSELGFRPHRGVNPYLDLTPSSPSSRFYAVVTGQRAEWQHLTCWAEARVDVPSRVRFTEPSGSTRCAQGALAVHSGQKPRPPRLFQKIKFVAYQSGKCASSDSFRPTPGLWANSVPLRASMQQIKRVISRQHRAVRLKHAVHAVITLVNPLASFST